MQLKTLRYWGWCNSIILSNSSGHQEDLLRLPLPSTVSIHPIVQRWGASGLERGGWTAAPGWLFCGIFPTPVHWSSVFGCSTNVISPQTDWCNSLVRICVALLMRFLYCNWSFGASSDSESGEYSLKLKGSRLKCNEGKFFLLGTRGNQWN